MSQLQVQHKTAFVNGGNCRQRDQDLGNGSENFRKEYQSNRSFRSVLNNQSHMDCGAHLHINQASSNTSISLAGSLSKDKPEPLAHSESRGGSQGHWNQDHLHLTACLIGQPVEVQVNCGSIYSGVFHKANAEKDHGIVLRMARLIKDSSSKGKCDIVRDSTMRPLKKYIIYAKDLVQIIAKDVPLKGKILQNGRMHENRAEIVTDPVLAQGRHGGLERELKPWTPDAQDFQDLELELTFENTWNRNWDQFKINRTLFGVESTFNEELYTTKLEKGPRMQEREREALRIAQEIEEQSAKNIHLAEERVAGLGSVFELLDEESRYSSVLRSSEDVGEENEEVNMDALNGETFGNLQNHAVAGMIAVDGENSLKKAWEIESNTTNRQSSSDLKKDSIVFSVDTEIAAMDGLENTHKEKLPCVVVGDHSNKHSSRVGGFSSPLLPSSIGDITGLQALNLDPGSPHVTEDVYRDFNEFRQQENAKRGKQLREEQVNELKSFSKSLKELTVTRQHVVATAGSPCKAAAACAPPASALPLLTSISNPTSTLEGSNTCVGSASLSYQSEQPSISSLSILNLDTPISPMNSTTSATTPSTPSASSDISFCASFSKKSSLNPHAKEFKLNPNAKSFTPNFTPLRPASPVVQGSVYAPGMLPSGPPNEGVPMGVPGNPQIPQAGQLAAKYVPYNNLGMPGASGGASFLPSLGMFAPRPSGAPLPPPLGGGQATLKVPPQLHQPAADPSYGSQQTIRYPPPAPSTYMHPTAHMYSQPMMFGQPGQVIYYQPYPQGTLMPPPQPTLAAPQLQSNHRAAGIQEMQMCVTPPYISGQQHFLPQVQMPQLSNPVQPTAGVISPNAMPTVQPPRV